MSIRTVWITVKKWWRNDRVFSVGISAITGVIAVVYANYNDDATMRRVAFFEDVGDMRSLESDIVLAVDALITEIAVTERAAHESRQAVSEAVTRQVMAARALANRSESSSVKALALQVEEYSLAVRRDLTNVESMEDVKAFMEGPLENYFTAERELVRELDKE